MSQRTEVIKYLRTHKKGITSKDAIDKLGITRLASVIFDLKRMGYKIECVRESVPTRYGHKASVARYKLV